MNCIPYNVVVKRHRFSHLVSYCVKGQPRLEVHTNVIIFSWFQVYQAPVVLAAMPLSQLCQTAAEFRQQTSSLHRWRLQHFLQNVVVAGEEASIRRLSHAEHSTILKQMVAKSSATERMARDRFGWVIDVESSPLGSRFHCGV